MLIVGIWSHTSFSKGLGGVSSIFFYLIELFLELLYFALSRFPKDLLDSWNDSCDINDLLVEGLNARLEVLVGWIMDDLPLSGVWVKDRVDFEDRNKLSSSLVTNNVLSKIEESILDGLLQRFLKTLINL
jgi:hypothetical protein